MNDWQEAEQRVERAHDLYESGRLEDAVRELREAIKVNPYQGEWHYNLGVTLEQLGRFSEAIESLSHAIECDGQEVDALNLLGICCTRLDQNEKALKYFNQAIELDPDNVDCYANCIATYGQLDRHDDAELMFYMAIDLDEEATKAWYNIGQSLLDRQDYQHALFCFEKVLSLDLADEMVRGRLGQVHWACGELEKAYRWYLDQLRQQPGDVDTLLDVGNLLVELKRPAEAAEKFRRLIETDPSNPHGYYHLGVLALRAGHIESAYQTLTQASKLDPTHPETLLHLATIALKRHHLREARRTLTKAIQLQKNSTEVQFHDQLGKLLIEADMPGKAIEIYKQLLAANPKDATHAHQLAAAMLRAGQLEAGERISRKAVKLDPTMIVAMRNLIRVNLMLGRPQRALHWLNKARKIDGQDKKLRQLGRRLTIRIMGRKIKKMLATMGRNK